MKVLELYSGTECLSNAFRANGHECYTVDWDEKYPSNLHIDIGKLDAELIIKEFGYPDVIWVGTDCTTFSVAAISKHRRKNPTTGNLDPISDYAKQCDATNKHVWELIDKLNPRIYIWENPRGGLRSMDYMQRANRQTTTYCQYGFPYMKPTDFFSNVDLKLKPRVKMAILVMREHLEEADTDSRESKVQHSGRYIQMNYVSILLPDAKK